MRLTSPHTLRGLMETKGYSQTRLARSAGLKDHTFISHLLAGRKTTCTPARAHLIAEALEVPLELLFIPSVSTDSGHTRKTPQTAGHKGAAA